MMYKHKASTITPTVTKKFSDYIIIGYTYFVHIYFRKITPQCRTVEIQQYDSSNWSFTGVLQAEKR